MTKPETKSALELVESARCRCGSHACADYGSELARRVGGVLALQQKRHANEGYDAALRDVMRILNGETIE